MARKRTWIEVAVANGGLRSAIKAIDWADAWIHVQVAHGHDPSVEEVAEWWNISRRSAFRGQAAFRACFPELESPESIYRNDRAMMDRVRRNVELLNKLDAAKRQRRADRDQDIISAGLINP